MNAIKLKPEFEIASADNQPEIAAPELSGPGIKYDDLVAGL